MHTVLVSGGRQRSWTWYRTQTAYHANGSGIQPYDAGHNPNWDAFTLMEFEQMASDADR